MASTESAGGGASALRAGGRRTLATTALSCAVIAALATYGGATIPIFEGLLFDAAVAARSAISPPSPDLAGPVAVIALDADSLASDELAVFPRTMLGPIWAETIEALAGAGVRVIAFDFLFAYSANALASRFPALKNYDQTFSCLSLKVIRQ